MEEVLERIQHFIDRTGMKRWQFAERCGLEPPHLSKLVNGHIAFDLKHLLRIAYELKVPVSVLVGDLPTPWLDLFDRLEGVLGDEGVQWWSELSDEELKLALGGAKDAVDLHRFRRPKG